MERVLVTGGAGYIGSHCCKALAEAGFEPVVFDNLSTGHENFVRWGPLIEGDVRDDEGIRAAMAQTRPVGVMHFAALSLVQQSVSAPGPFYDVNVGGTLRLVAAMRDVGVPAIVFSSTCAVYRESDGGLITESTPLNPVSPYGATKAACERLLADFEAACDLRFMSLRYFNAAGADQDSVVGEWHDPETHLIPIALDAVLGRREALRLYGTDYETEDGTAVRDYIHVDDLAAAHVSALKILLKGGESDVLNLGTGRGSSMTEVVRAVEEVTDRPVPLEEAARRAGDSPSLVADPEQARKRLGWRSRHDLLRMVDDAWRWHQKLPAA